MQLMRRHQTWNPFSELESLSSRMNQLFDVARWPGETELFAAVDWTPKCNVVESDKEYRVQAELPNVRKDDVHVTFEDGTLTIQGERRAEKEERGLKLHRRELSYGNFLRRFTMPEDADESKIDATFKDGMLDVKIAKSKERTAQSREIVVH